MDKTLRGINFNSLQDINKELITLLYGSYESYLDESPPFDLEEYIFSYDVNMYHMGIISKLGERIGIYLDMEPDFDTSTHFYLILKEILTKKSQDKFLDVIINMNETSFNEYLTSIGKSELIDNNSVYLDRLYLYANDFSAAYLKSHIS